ncbi:MAG: recombinase family protein, partial [Kiritimatiellaeota bacterium]|nr:recombinase family protein [Kiritimatiellota bacterium]
MNWYTTRKAYAKRAVAYYRHSAQDRQENSIEIQQDQVRKFAEDNGIQIIEEFVDRGKTGLVTEGREAFQTMLRDYIQSGKYDFDFVLVLDVSRWGRYQNTDIAAYYTGLCAVHGKSVVYTSIGFSPTNDLMHGLRINIERYQAANYSRELSTKVFKGCAKIASQGFRAGGMPPFAFHRLLLDEQRKPVQILDPGQRKSIQNQRVTLTPGAPDEIAVIKTIFRAFVQHKKSPKQIAATLNGENVRSPVRRVWTAQSVQGILSNELYAGTMIYNKTTQRLKSPSHKNPKAEWIRAENAFTAIIARNVFDSAQAMIHKAEEHRLIRYSNKDMLERLHALYTRYGTVRAKLIAGDKEMVAPATYTHHFGTLGAAYQNLFADVIAERRAQVVTSLRASIPEITECGDFFVLRDYVSVRIQPVVPYPNGYEAAW